MKSKRGPTLRAQWLGRQLREFRDAAKLTLKDAGDYIQRDPAAISRLENGISPARVPDVLMLLNLYGVSTAKTRDGMERLSRDIWQKGWWDGYAEEATGRVIDLAWLESRVQELRSYDAIVFHGLLQTREYAREVITAAEPEASKSYVSRWVDFRMQRQRVLGEDDPAFLSFILDEALLHRAVGGPEIMHDQLQHLIGLAEHPAVLLRVLPFSTGAHASPEGPFAIFEMPDPYPDVAYVESRAGSLYVEAEGVDPFEQAYDCLRHAALSPEQSIALITEAARNLNP